MLAQAVQMAAPDQRQTVRKALESSLCCWENDVDGYLAAAGGVAPAFESAFLRGQLQQAADMINAGPKHDADIFRGLALSGGETRRRQGPCRRTLAGASADA